MAPLTTFIVPAMHGVHTIRSLGSTNSTHGSEFLTQSQGNILQCLALSFSLISITSAMLAFHWFMKMERTYRHDLVMLLIQSDMFKALWLMTYPIVTFTQGPILSSSTFCQVNGFFIALGIEASDIAVLMIAIHSALYIFRPKVTSGEGGLYPYRNIAYVVWMVLPILLASLAFINGDNAYTSEGTYCYLPVRPFWYRLALAWIPRYVIFLIILGIYASIYYYVQYKFHGFTNMGKANSNDTDGEKPHRRPRREGLPLTPTLACHGLIPESRQDSGSLEEAKQIVSPLRSARPPNTTSPASAHRFMWANLIAADESTDSQASSLDNSSADTDSFTGPVTPQPLPQLKTTFPQSPQGSLQSVDPSRSRDTSCRDGFVSRLSLRPATAGTGKHSMVDIFSVLRHRPGETEAPTPVSQLQLTNSHGQNMAVSEMLKTREKIRRQLRFLFIYPLVYIGMWIIPFVYHVMQYNDKYALDPPFVMTCLTTVCVCSQAAVDCWLFSTREKPWRHIPGTNGSFISSLKFWSGWNGVHRRTVKAGPGKTREERVREARAAYRRRDEEIAQRRNEAGQGGRVRDMQRLERDWWETAGLDGCTNVTPATATVSNPMENIGTEASNPNTERPMRPERVHFKEPESHNDRIEGAEGATKTISTEDESPSSSST